MPALDGDDGFVIVRGRPAPYRVRVSPRARHAALHIHSRRGLEVVLPPGATPSLAADLLREKAAWLDRNATDVHRARRRVPMRPGAQLPYRGQWCTLVLVPSAKSRASVDLIADILHVRTPATANTDADAIRATLERWYRARARSVFFNRVRALRQSEDGKIVRLSVRDQDGCWGSCTGGSSIDGGSLSFSWRLVMAPPAVLDAVVAHELVHLTQPDHSHSFWAALDARFPQHRACRRWLDANAYRLGL